MKRIAIMPKSRVGKWAFLAGVFFVVTFFMKTSMSGLPIPTVIQVGIGILGFLLAIIALVKKDRSVGTIFPIVAGAAILFVLVAMGVGMLGLFKEFEVKKALTTEEAGQPINETVNFGIVSESPTAVYYIDNGKIIIRSRDWTQRKVLPVTEATSIYVSEPWVYYRDSEDTKGLYRVRVNGMGKQNLVSGKVQDYIAAGGYVFYTPSELYDSKQQVKPGMTVPVYRMKSDGTGKQKFCTVGAETKFQVSGSWLYFVNDGNLYRIRTKGGQPKLIADNASFSYIYNNWIYWTVQKDTSEGKSDVSIYRISVNGTDKSEVLAFQDIYQSEFYGADFYFSTFKKTYRAALDGGKAEQMNTVQAWELIGVTGDWMYIHDYEGPMFRVKMDGSFGTRMN